MKILGKRKLFKKLVNDRFIYIPAVLTKLPYANDINGKPFLSYLEKMDFSIIKYNRRIIKTYLPVQWIHVKLYENGHIYDLLLDEYLRPRIKISRMTKNAEIYTRFNYNIKIFKKENEFKVIYHIIDSDKIIMSSDVTKDLLMCENEEEIINVLNRFCSYILDKVFPEWRDPLSYWDYEQNDFVEMFKEQYETKI